MKQLLALTAIFLSMTMMVQGQIAPIHGEILRDDLVDFRDGKYVLKAEPDNRRALADPAMMFHVNIPMDVGGVVGVETFVSSQETAELEMQAVYNGETYYSFPRRTVNSDGNLVSVRWQVANLDQVTSLTLSVRQDDPDSEVKLDALRFQDFNTFSVKNRLDAFTDAPFFQKNVTKPGEDGKLTFGLVVPEDLKIRLKGSSPSITLKDGKGFSAKTAIETPLPVAGEKEWVNRAEVKIPMPPLDDIKDPDSLTATLSIRDGGEDVEICTVPISVIALEIPSFEVPGHSIEDFSVLVKSGELGIYSLCAQEGVVAMPGGAPVTNDLVWLTVGNGKEWVINKLLFAGRRDIAWLGGGPVSFQAGMLGSNIYAFFTAAWQDGREGLCFARAQSTYFVTPSTKNPVWMPSSGNEGHLSSMFRGLGFFDLNGDSMIAALELLPDGGAQVRALASPIQTRWVDLGPLPLPGLNQEALSLSGYQNGQDFYLITDPVNQMYHASDSPLRGWEQIPFDPPAGWEDIQLVEWHEQLWAFAIKRINKVGVVVWAPVEQDDKSFQINTDYTFNPVALRQYRTP